VTEEKTDYYEVIGVSPDTSQEALRKAYRIALRDSHPDKPDGNAERFVQVQEAWATLGDPQKRENYDYLRQRPSTPKSAPQAKPQPSQDHSSGQASPSPKQSTPPKTESAQSQQAQTETTPPPRPKPKARPQQQSEPSYSTKAPNIDDVLGIAPDNDLDQEEPTYTEPEPIQEEITDLKKWKFVPSTKNVFQKAGIGFAVSLIATIVAFFIFLPSPLVFIPAGLVLLGSAILSVDYTGRNKKWGVGGVLVGAVGFIVAFLLSGAASEIVPLALVVSFIGGAMFTYSQANEISKIRFVDKQVPSKLLRRARVFGSPIGSTPDESVTLRNLSDQIVPITNRLDGTFAVHVSGTPMPEGQSIPTLMVVARNNKVCLLTAIGEQGDFSVDNNGNIIKINAGSGFQHMRNINPQILKASAYLEKKFKGTEVFSLVVMGQVSQNKTVGKTILTDSAKIESAFVDLFAEDNDHVVRRDLINHYVPAITSA